MVSSRRRIKGDSDLFREKEKVAEEQLEQLEPLLIDATTNHLSQEASDVDQESRDRA